MIHRLLLEVERAEQEDCAFGHFRRHDLLANGEQRRSPELQVHWTCEERILSRHDVVELDATLCILSEIERGVSIKLLRTLLRLIYVQ